MKYEILVKPGSKLEKIEEKDGKIVVFIHARAHDGEANKAVIKNLAEYFNVPKTSIKILVGEKSRKKIVEI